MSGIDLTELAWDLASDGFGTHGRAVNDVVRVARARGVSPVLVEVLAGADQPDVARLRAFGAIAMALAEEPSGVVRPAA